MAKYLLIALGGALGALARFFVVLLSTKFFSGTFPVGTLLVNVVGSFLVTLLMQVFLQTSLDPLYRYFLVVGFLGAFTTFSSFTFETITILKEHACLMGMLNVFLNLFLSFLAGILGIVTANFMLFK